MSAKLASGGLALGLCAVLLTGCSTPVQHQVDAWLGERARHSFDQEILPAAHTTKGTPPAAEIQQAGIFLPPAQESKQLTTLEARLMVPASIPGADAPLIFLPKDKLTAKERLEAIVKQFFPPIAKLLPDPDFPPGPDGRPLSLGDLQQIAIANSPQLRQAAADVEAARGVAIQAGLYPNPTLGYIGNSPGPSGGPTMGVVVGQTIKTMGKLKLAQAAAAMDLQSAEIAYRRAESELMSAVRSHYYGVLVAQESIRANRGLVELTTEVYRVLVDQLKVGEVATYEPLQLSVFAAQARTALVQARNTRLLAWKQLAAAAGVPHMPPVLLAGQVHRPVPCIDFEKALAHVLTHHTDVLTTAKTIEKARHTLRLAEVTPYPDVNVQASVQNDLTPPGPSRVITGVQVSVPVPIFDRNQGGIRQAQANLLRANEEPHRVQAELTARFSEAYRRYDETRVLLEMYRKDILPRQVQAFRAAVKRHYGAEPDKVAYTDLVSSEQNLVIVVGAYLGLLGGQWQATVDVAGLLQTPQLYALADEINTEPEVDFEHLLRLPCRHGCSTVWPIPTHEGFRLAPVFHSGATSR